MSDNSLLIYLGTTLSISGLAAIFRPQTFVRESRRNWKARLRELDAGAPETYFEERRELEAYPPRFDISHRTLRWLGVIGLIVGGLCILHELTT